MENDIRNLFKRIDLKPLTGAERSRVRNELVAFMNEHPVRARSIRGGYGVFIETWNKKALHRAVYAMAIVAVVCGGTAYAAEGTLPGDVLYPIKISVTERVEGALALSHESKAEWNTKRISRRLSEAETLAAAGALSDERSAEIEAHINTATDELVITTQVLAQGADGGLALASVQSNVEAALIGHEHVLESIRENSKGEDLNLVRLLGRVRAHAESARIARASMEAEISGRNDERVRVAATLSKDDADTAISSVRTYAEQELSAEPRAAAEVSASAMRIEEAVEIGDEELRQGKYGEAFGTFQAAIRAARAVKVHIEAETRLKQELEAGHSSSTNATSTEDSDEKNEPGDSEREEGDDHFKIRIF